MKFTCASKTVSPKSTTTKPTPKSEDLLAGNNPTQKVPPTKNTLPVAGSLIETSKPSPAPDAQGPWVYTTIVLASTFIVLVVIVLVFLFCMMRKRSAKKMQERPPATELQPLNQSSGGSATVVEMPCPESNPEKPSLVSSSNNEEGLTVDLNISNGRQKQSPPGSIGNSNQNSMVNGSMNQNSMVNGNLPNGNIYSSSPTASNSCQCGSSTGTGHR